MPSFFGRRYMRGKPGRTERLVGALVLCLLALIVGLFALTGGLFASVVERVPLLSRAKDAVGLSERPLFVPDPENVKPPEPPHEMRQAMALLPEKLGEWTRNQLSVQRIDGDPESADCNAPWGVCYEHTMLPNDLKVYGPATLYSAEYAVSESGLKMHVYVADVGDPDAAFGLYSRYATGRFAPVKLVPIGRGGWTAHGVIAFWSGRFYTSLIPQEHRNPPDLLSAAQLVASVQLSYGGPFWAESVLPREGRVPNSLQFLKPDIRSPFEWHQLPNCWVAAYNNGLIIGVMQPSSPEKLLENLKQRAASRPAEVHVMESEALAATVVTLAANDKTLTAFGAGPYVFVIVAPPQQSELVASTARMLHDRWSGPDASALASASFGATHPQSASRDPQSPAAGVARFAEVDGLDAPVKTERYTDNLYEKIDGREGQFRAFNFVELRFGQYLDNRNRHSFDVYLYDMGAPDNALGIFMKERSSAEGSAGIGRDSYVSGTSVYFWEGRYYVNVLGPADGGETALASARKIAAAIAETIADTGSGFWAEEVLPREDQVPESFRYIATSALSYDFLNRVYRADYKTDGKTYGLFALKASSPERARELFLQLADAAKRYGDEIEQRVDTPGSELLVTRSLDIYMVAFCKGVFLGGVADCDDKELAIAKAQLLRERMPIDAPGEPEPVAADASAGQVGEEAASGDDSMPGEGEGQGESDEY